jgi:hypothetical protein
MAWIRKQAIIISDTQPIFDTRPRFSSLMDDGNHVLEEPLYVPKMSSGSFMQEPHQLNKLNSDSSSSAWPIALLIL